MQDFNEKVIVITGGATGIGFALAKQFAERGARIVIAARRRERLDEAAAILAASSTEVRVFECDVTQRDQVEALADFAWEQFGRVDVIVNNAGVLPTLATVIETKQEDVQRVFDVDFFGVWNGVSVFGQRFIAQGTPAAIYNVGSENCFFSAVPQGGGYVAAKHAVLAMTEALREELPDHIEVSLICPGLVKSELGEVTNHGMDTDKFAVLAMTQILAGEFLIVSHAYNMVRIQARYEEIKTAYTKYAPRYQGDNEFDVRTLSAESN
ncbi:SDR family oxidoreductase [Leptolyngbya sp. FACHB-261]|nr:SDR family oxidoreductase [Cyanobacteria bacterium FACHB-471]MBD2100954.1 SDR family oxidoreductase [Leptolyngbya sp. FACHB-261]